MSARTGLVTQSVSLTWPSHKIDLPDFEVAAGNVLAIVGPSGCGKSSWLRWLAGEQLTHVEITGDIQLNGEQVTQQPLGQRKVGMLMQDVLLFPHLNVIENLIFALPAAKRQQPQQAKAYVAEQLAAVEMAEFANADVSTLSGGQKARIGLLRTLLAEPRLVLLDEPFGALDVRLREQVREWTFAQLTAANVTTVLVTHDQADIPAAAQRFDWEQGHV